MPSSLLSSSLMPSSSPPPPPPPPPSHPQMSPLSAHPPATTTTRRLPPPCWSYEETLALITSYRDKWYSLRRGNLRAVHWQEVADSVSRICPRSHPPKTSVQCRHKMEKLRKRYRSELQRAQSIPNHRFSSSWIHFKEMDSMEKGPSPSSSSPVGVPTLAIAAAAEMCDDEDGDGDGDDDDDGDGDESYDVEENRLRHSGEFGFDGYDRRGANGVGAFHGSMSNGVGKSGSGIRISGGWESGSGSRAENYGGFGDKPSSGIGCGTNKFGFSGQTFDDGGVSYSTRVVKSAPGTGAGASRLGTGLGKRDREVDDPVMEMVMAIKKLGEGFVKMERMKMDMAREIEQMRMEMDMKRTEMILEAQQRMVEAFVKGVLEARSKKAKAMSSNEH